MKVTCQCGGVLRRPIPPVCPHCGAVVIGARRSPWQLLITWGVPVALVVGLMVVIFILYHRLSPPAPPPKPKPERTFDRNL